MWYDINLRRKLSVFLEDGIIEIDVLGEFYKNVTPWRMNRMAEGDFTKQKVADALIEMAKTQPLDKITVRDISVQSGINRQTFYYHFRDKTELLNWVYNTNFLDPYLKGMTKNNWKENMIGFLTKLRDNRDFILNSTVSSFNPVLENTIRNIARLFLQIVESHDQENLLNEMQRHAYARFMAFGFFGTVGDWIRNGARSTPELLVEKMEKFINSSNISVLAELRS